MVFRDASVCSTGPSSKSMRDVTLSEIERLRLQADETEVAFEMDEQAFCAFYDRTARALWGYLARVTGDAQLADDLLQETYYRFLRARGRYETETHRRAYLYRIATNLARDGFRRRAIVRTVALPDEQAADLPSQEQDLALRTERRTDLQRAMIQLRPRERQILWLAYAQGSSHREIADSIGVKPGSVKLLLFRARRKLVMMLECGREQDVLDAVTSSRWPERCDDELRAHVAGCAVCADLVEIVGPIGDARDTAWESAKVPPAPIVWWRARIRAREEALRAASRPLNLAYAAALLVFGALTGGVFVTLLPEIRTWVSTIVTAVQWPAAAKIAATLAPLAGSTIVILAAATSLLVAPIAIWLALRDDA
jgi:RNA polymerase sigma-70 factor (ECF subfamily)